MMMKLMKFLVVALVAGGVFAPVASQAGGLDGKALRCEEDEEYDADLIPFGVGVVLLKFDNGRVYRYYVSPLLEDRANGLEIMDYEYRETSTEITWVSGHVRVDRKTLVYTFDEWTRAQCELIDHDELVATYQPWVDHQRALFEKASEGNKL